MKWNDTADDWDAILDGTADRAEPKSESETSAQSTATANTQAETPQRAASDGGVVVENPATLTAPTQPTAGLPEELVRINPIETQPLEAMVRTLPPVWLSDPDMQRISQWVVHSFLTETDEADSTPARTKASLKRAADRTGLTASGLAVLCTRTLYGGQGASGSQLYADLEAIEDYCRD